MIFLALICRWWYTVKTVAEVAELVDALDSGSSGETRGGSSPLLGTRFSHDADRFFTNRRRFLTIQRSDFSPC